MSYTVSLTSKAQKQIRKLEKSIQKDIINALDALSTNPRPHGCIKLKGREAWRIRIGKYRVIYEIDDGVLVVTVVNVDNRGRVYQ